MGRVQSERDAGCSYRSSLHVWRGRRLCLRWVCGSEEHPVLVTYAEQRRAPRATLYVGTPNMYD